jgi:hypothetical protein
MKFHLILGLGDVFPIIIQNLLCEIFIDIYRNKIMPYGAQLSKKELTIFGHYYLLAFNQMR